MDIDFDDEVEGDTLVEVLVQHRAHIHEFTINMCELEALRVVLSHPVVASLPAIRLGGIDAYWGPDALELLVEADLPSLRSLSLFGASELQDEHCRILAAAPNLRGLRVLRLERPAWQGIPMHEITDDGVLALVAAFPGLSWLDLAGCASASDAVLPAVAALRELSAFAVPGVSGSGAALAWSDPSLPGLVARLTHLDLSESGVDVSRVLDGPTRLRYLQLARTVADPEQVGRLAETEGLTELRHLGFFDATDWDSIDESGPEGANPISRDDVEAFMDNPRFPELQYVDFLNADDYPEAMHRGPDGACGGIAEPHLRPRTALPRTAVSGRVLQTVRAAPIPPNRRLLRLRLGGFRVPGLLRRRTVPPSSSPVVRTRQLLHDLRLILKHEFRRPPNDPHPPTQQNEQPIPQLDSLLRLIRGRPRSRRLPQLHRQSARLLDRPQVEDLERLQFIA